MSAHIEFCLDCGREFIHLTCSRGLDTSYCENCLPEYVGEKRDSIDSVELEPLPDEHY